MREQLEKLVEQWRVHSESLTRTGTQAEHTQDGRWWAGEAEGCAKCADELAVLLAAPLFSEYEQVAQGMEAAVAADYAAPVREPGPEFAQELSDAMNEGRWKDATFRLVWKVDAIHRLLAAKDAEIATLKGAMRAQDEREQRAGLACGVLWLAHGCDWPDAVAERVIALRQQLAELTEATLDAFSDKLRAQQAEAALAESRAEWQRLSDLLRMGNPDPPFLIGAVQAMQHSEAESRQDLALNATMLARQCDLARDAEALLAERTAERDRLKAEAEAAKLRAYRQARVFEPSMDGYAGAMAVYHAAFPDDELDCAVKIHVADITARYPGGSHA